VSVTLVITSYNHGHFLAEAIDSALSQTHPFQQILVVDDGSTDDTTAVAARYPQVVCIRQPNSGLSAARNSGLREARGDFVVFLDADDRLRPEAVEAGLRCFESSPGASFVYGRYRFIQPSGEAMPAAPLRAHGADAYLDFLRGNCVEMHATVMYRRESILELQGFDEELRACEDYDLYLRIARRGQVASHETVVADYRRHESNMSRDARLMLLTSLAVLERQRPYARGNRERRRAFREGVRNWQDCYGTKLAGQIARQFRAGVSRRALAKDLGLLLTRAPYALIANRRRIYRAVMRKSLSWLPFRLGGRLAALPRLSGFPPPRGQVALGDLCRLEPLSREFGFDRGTPVDRYYIGKFLAGHSRDIRGHVLEIGDNHYTQHFGGARVTVSDVLNVYPAGGSTTIVADLSTGSGIPDDTFDCLIVTQTLHLLWDMAAGVRTLYRVLKPGGILLLTVPGTISQLEQGQWRSTWYWGLGPLAAERLFGEVFPAPGLQVTSHGNVLTSTCFLQGMAAEELKTAELDHRDALYPLLITVRAVKPVSGTAP